MSRPRRSLALIILALAPALLITGCSSAPTGVTLSSTKAPAQLLRNEVASRVPPAIVESLGETEDSSVGCGDDGMRRSWRSSVLMFVEPGSAWRIDAVAEDVVKSLTDEEWTATVNKDSETITRTTLRNPKTNAVISLQSTEPVDEKGNGSTLAISADGPCVDTAGPDSDEVKDLEGRE